MPSEVSIANMALSHLQVGRTISSLAEQSEEAEACNAFYEVARDAVLRDFAWPVATRIVQLELVEEDPNSEWAYSYRYPRTCLFFRRILSGTREDTVSTKVDYQISSDDEGKLVFTDQDDAEAEISVLYDEAGHFDADFALALSWRLAFYIAPRVSKSSAQASLWNAYKMELAQAAANAANESPRPARRPESEFINARN